MGNINGGIFDTRAIFRCLGDGIYLSMDSTKAVLLVFSIGGLGFVNKTTDIEAMRHAGRRAVVSGGENILVPDDNRAHFRPVAGRALRHLLRDSHEILVPTGPIVHKNLRLVSS